MRESDRDIAAAAAERRERGRVPTAKPAVLTPSRDETAVTVENTSVGGLFAVLDGSLEFEITFEGDWEPRRVQLVRSQSLPGGKLGIGFKFVDQDDPGETI
ncbi:MAG: PilZ domain-containing protein [Planctomycetota bacterium]